MRAPTYVRMDTTYKADGTIMPTALYWKDSTPFVIESAGYLAWRKPNAWWRRITV